MGLFNKLKEPIFLKESSNIEEQIYKLKALKPFLNFEGQDMIRRDIRCLEYGEIGEKNIIFELRNSNMPMYILRDIYLEFGDLNAQIDYIVFTRKICFIIECKNLYGNIEINNKGDFIRSIEVGGRRIKEGIYSPITQNQRHLDLIEQIKINNNKNIIMKFIASKSFDNFYKSVVVLANPKTVINDRFAKKEIKDKIVKADGLVKYIKDLYKKSEVSIESDAKLLKWAQSILKLHKEIDRDYTSKYNKYRLDSNSNTEMSTKLNLREDYINNGINILEESELFKELKLYRLNKSKEEKIKPYFIYNDNQLKDLISKMPKSKKELLNVHGFGEIKVNKYGNDIIEIVSKH